MPSARCSGKPPATWLIHVLHIPLATGGILPAEYSQNAYYIMIQGATPIPYKLVTIASGLAGVSFPLFMLYSAITRSVRYLVIEATLVHFFGDRAHALLEKYLEWALILFLVVLVLGFVALRYIVARVFCAVSSSRVLREAGEQVVYLRDTSRA